MLGYTASKHGVVGRTKASANYLAEHSIRVNCIAPSGVNTPMATNRTIVDYVKVHPGSANKRGGGGTPPARS